MKKHTIIALLVLFTAIAFTLRLVPHSANVTALASVLLFTGFLLPRKFALIPLGALVVSDMIIGSYTTGVMMAVYASYAIIVTLALVLKNKYSIITVLGSSVLGAVLFFVLTNAAVWQFTGMYTHSLSGLLASYTAGIPFFRNTLISYVLFSGLFFGVYEFLAVGATQRASGIVRSNAKV